jgi:hypothetical protein
MVPLSGYHCCAGHGPDTGLTAAGGELGGNTGSYSKKSLLRLSRVVVQ